MKDYFLILYIISSFFLLFYLIFRKSKLDKIFGKLKKDDVNFRKNILERLKKKRSEILWNRILSCGHSRQTDIAYTLGNYDKPKIGQECSCRICMFDCEIIKVEKIEEKI